MFPVDQWALPDPTIIFFLIEIRSVSEIRKVLRVCALFCSSVFDLIDMSFRHANVLKRGSVIVERKLSLVSYPNLIVYYARRNRHGQEDSAYTGRLQN